MGRRISPQDFAAHFQLCFLSLSPSVFTFQLLGCLVSWPKGTRISDLAEEMIYMIEWKGEKGCQSVSYVLLLPKRSLTGRTTTTTTREFTLPFFAPVEILRARSR